MEGIENYQDIRMNKDIITSEDITKGIRGIGIFAVCAYVGFLNIMAGGGAAFSGINPRRNSYPSKQEIREEQKKVFGGDSVFGKFNYFISAPSRELSMFLFHDESRVVKK